MPIPFIIAGLAVAAAGYGVKKGMDAKDDFDRAENINSKAKEIYSNGENKLNNVRKKTKNMVEALGKTKFHIYENSLIPFVDTFSKIKNINFDDSKLFSATNLPRVTKEELANIKNIAVEMKDVVGGGIASLGAGGLAGLAAYGGVGLLGAASTGTSIAALSGAAATNATLAWLGGGSLAAGGFGMAGGMAVLGGIVAGPVLAVGGMMLASKAEEAKENAYSNLQKAELAVEQMKTAEVLTDAIYARFNQVDTILNYLNNRFEPLFEDLTHLVSYSTNYATYSDDDKKGLFYALSLMKSIKNIMECPLLDESGNINTGSDQILIEADKYLN